MAGSVRNETGTATGNGPPTAQPHQGRFSSEVGASVSPLPASLRLPRTSTRLQRGWAHCRVLTGVQMKPYAEGFEGPILPAGSICPFSHFGSRPVVLECVGPIGTKPARGKQREVLWILWSYDFERSGWKELARASAVNWEWAECLRAPAMAALHPEPDLIDVLHRGRVVSEEILELLRASLTKEPRPVQVNALAALSVRLAGLIAEEIERSGLDLGGSVRPSSSS